MFGFVNQVDLIKVSFSKEFPREEIIRFSFRLGKGIYLVRDTEELKEKFAEIDNLDRRKQVSLKPMKRIIQRLDKQVHFHRNQFL